MKYIVINYFWFHLSFSLPSSVFCYLRVYSGTTPGSKNLEMNFWYGKDMNFSSTDFIFFDNRGELGCLLPLMFMGKCKCCLLLDCSQKGCFNLFPSVSSLMLEIKNILPYPILKCTLSSEYLFFLSVSSIPIWIVYLYLKRKEKYMCMNVSYEFIWDFVIKL